MLDFILVRLLFILILGFTAGYFHPATVDFLPGVGAGIALGLFAIVLERRLAKVSLKRLLGLAGGVLTGLFCAALFSFVLSHLGPDHAPALQFVQIASMAILVFLGAAIGAAKGELLNLAAFGGLFGAESQTGPNRQILDTSVIIDGRIADIADTGFLDGILVVPQFVLHELQMVADSADSMKRTRGRRGLDVLQRIQKMAHVKVEIVSEDFPHVKEVDMKLIELARLFNCKIMTNDFNLNKVAHVRGVDVLNINELTNSLRPIVLPGELMRVFILKEGKEYNQGVAYLDDGTMVVVDNARRLISKTVDVTVTSVLQTTAGKMIFGKYDERVQHLSPERPVMERPVLERPVLERRDEPMRREQAVGEN